MLREIQRKYKSLSGSQRFKGFKALQTQSVQFYLLQVNPHLLVAGLGKVEHFVNQV